MDKLQNTHKITNNAMITSSRPWFDRPQYGMPGILIYRPYQKFHKCLTKFTNFLLLHIIDEGQRRDNYKRAALPRRRESQKLANKRFLFSMALNVKIFMEI